MRIRFNVTGCPGFAARRIVTRGLNESLPFGCVMATTIWARGTPYQYLPFVVQRLAFLRSLRPYEAEAPR